MNEENDDEDICGLCGEPGADKVAHPVHWPGERVPDGPYVHADCENEETREAFPALTEMQRESFLRAVSHGSCFDTRRYPYPPSPRPLR